MTESTGGQEAPLAEFVALRQEIDSMQSYQQQILNLQITISGTIFGFAIASVNLSVANLLIVPFNSYMLCARMIGIHLDIANLGQYIRDELPSRLPGLHWET